MWGNVISLLRDEKCLQILLSERIHTYMHTHTHIHTYINIYVHTHIHTYTHIQAYIRTYIHTHIHTYIYTSNSYVNDQAKRVVLPMHGNGACC